MVSLLLSLVFSLSVPDSQVAKDEFAFNNRGEPETIDPAKATGVPDNTIVVQIFQGLLTRKGDWVSLIPGDSETYTRSKDGLTYTFKLRKNLKWSDGSPLNAQDYIYSWLRAINPATTAQYGFWLTDNIEGAAEYFKAPTSENEKKVGFKAVDDYTIVVKLVRPLSYFPHLVAESIFYPVKKSIIEKYGDRWTRPEYIVSNGPFQLTQWGIQDKIVMEKNPHFYDAKDIKLKKLTALPLEDRQTAMNLYKQGKLDWSGHNGLPNSLVPSMLKDPSFRTFPAFTTYFYRFNTKRPPLDNKLVRQALTLAIDRKSLVEQVTRGSEIPAGFLVPLNTGKYKSPKGLVSSDYQSDVERAKKLLKEAGYGPGGKTIRPLVIMYNTDENHKKVALAVQQMWKKALNIEVISENKEWKVYLKTQSAMDFDISRSAWQGDYPDPSAFLENFLSSSGNNHTGFSNPKFDELFFKANSTGDEKARLNYLFQGEELLLEESPIAPIYIYSNFGLLRPEVIGFEANLIDRPMFRFVSKK